MDGGAVIGAGRTETIIAFFFLLQLVQELEMQQLMNK